MSEGLADTTSDGTQYQQIKLTYSPLTLLSAPFMSSTARLKTKTVFANFRCYVTNLNNFPLKLRVWTVKPKADFSFDNEAGLGSITTLMDMAWEAVGGTDEDWTNDVDFDWTMIPGVNSLLASHYLGEFQLEPQTEKLMFSKRWSNAYTRARAQAASNANVTNHLTRQDRFLFYQVISPMISGATAVGRADGTLYFRAIWQEKWAVQNMAIASLGSLTTDAGVSGASTVFHRDYVTTGSAVKGTTTLA